MFAGSILLHCFLQLTINGQTHVCNVIYSQFTCTVTEIHSMFGEIHSTLFYSLQL
jgi:hypothetical protein